MEGSEKHGQKRFFLDDDPAQGEPSKRPRLGFYNADDERLAQFEDKIRAAENEVAAVESQVQRIAAAMDVLDQRLKYLVELGFQPFLNDFQRMQIEFEKGECIKTLNILRAEKHEMMTKENHLREKERLLRQEKILLLHYLVGSTASNSKIDKPSENGAPQTALVPQALPTKPASSSGNFHAEAAFKVLEAAVAAEDLVDDEYAPSLDDGEGEKKKSSTPKPRRAHTTSPKKLELLTRMEKALPQETPTEDEPITIADLTSAFNSATKLQKLIKAHRKNMLTLAEATFRYFYQFPHLRPPANNITTLFGRLLNLVPSCEEWIAHAYTVLLEMLESGKDEFVHILNADRHNDTNKSLPLVFAVIHSVLDWFCEKGLLEFSRLQGRQGKTYKWIREVLIDEDE